MAFSLQLPGSFNFNKYRLPPTATPSAGRFNKSTESCYSYVEKISALTNPASLQHDVLYGNTFAGTLEQTGLPEYDAPLALGCVGHQVDKEFPLESKTPISLPLVMYRKKKTGKIIEDVDMCAQPVLNWEEYMKQLKPPSYTVTNVFGRKRSGDKSHHQTAETDGETSTIVDDLSSRRKELSKAAWIKLNNQPKCRVEGTWNYLYGGNSGACCVTKCKSSQNPRLYVGKGPNLRTIELKNANPTSLFTFKVESMYDEAFPAETVLKSDSDDPFDEIILEIVPNESNNLLGTRRGRSIQIYDTSEDTPVLLESIPNKYYGTKHYNDRPRRSVANPLLRGFDFSPNYAPEIITIDENHVIRICNMCERATVSEFTLPDTRPLLKVPKNYPFFQVNDAAGIEFSSFGQVFMAWGDSTVYFGDRRSTKYSREQISPIFNLRKHSYSLSTSYQKHFHEPKTRLNEYMSCLKRSKKDMLYYVGTSSRIFLMDLRVPNHPVLSASHGLQSPLAYLDIQLDPNEIFETVVGSSQRYAETFSMICDSAHLECVQQPGCKGRYPVLQSYPRHLLNARHSFDTIIEECYDFPFPVDHDLTKSHFYAWTTGLATLPLASTDDGKFPCGVAVITSNHFGEVFWQEWDQKPLPNHKKADISHPKLQTFLKAWHKGNKEAGLPCRGNRSKNVNRSEDCTVLVEPLAREIENLLVVRDKPFDCFKPDPVIFKRAQLLVKPVNEFCDKMEKYKSNLVKGILDTWRMVDREAAPEVVTLPEVKVELTEFEEGHSPSGTICLDSEDEFVPSNTEDGFGNHETVEDFGSLIPNEMDFDNTDFQDSQECNSVDEISITLPTVRDSINKVKKVRKSGFQ